MPYKHIAAHLNKTELACRLHYHQLSHGSSRRKRTASTSSGSDQSPVMTALTPSPHHERIARSISPPSRHDGRFTMTPPPQHNDVHLPSIVANGCSPHMAPILPKPASMGFNSRASSPLGYATSLSEPHTTQLPPVSFRRESSLPVGPSSLRLDGGLPLPSSSTHTPAHVDLNRLQSVYAAHRDKFWDLVATEYGSTLAPATLEKAWRTGRCCSPAYGPLASPKEDETMSMSRAMAASRDKTRISSLISTD